MGYDPLLKYLWEDQPRLQLPLMVVFFSGLNIVLSFQGLVRMCLSQRGELIAFPFL